MQEVCGLALLSRRRMDRHFYAGGMWFGTFMQEVRGLAFALGGILTEFPLQKGVHQY
jgi:hypothetical protein